MKSWGFRNLALVLGLLLLVTGSLKTHAAFSGRPLDTFFFASRWEILAIAEFEFLLGGWLIAGLYPLLAWRCALMSFLCFLGVSLFTAFSGESSCSCFGVLKASPWIAASIDSAALIALLLCRGCVGGLAPTFSPFRQALAVVSVLSLLALPMLFAVSGNANSPLLVPSKPVLELGALSAGERRSASFWLTNNGYMPVELERIESSCHCLFLECVPPVIPPSASVRVNLTLDLGKEPGFVGNLRMHVQGRTPSGQLALSVQVRAKVRDFGSLPQPQGAALSP